MKKKYARWIVLTLLLAVVVAYFGFYQPIFGTNVRLEGDATEKEFFIRPGTTYEQVGKKLIDDKILIDARSFHRVAKMMNYPRNVHSGRYVIEDGMSNRELVTRLRSGSQTPVQYTFIKFRSVEELAEHTSQRLAMSPMELLNVLQNETFLKKVGGVGLTPGNVLAIFIPNTYEMYWDINPEQFVERMYKEYRAFWNEGRNAKADQWGLTRLEVMTLASIVEEETNKEDERPTVAGLYLNRVRKGWKLEADPTVKFAVGDFTLRRLLYSHLEVDSPYNTYMYEGIPPGPICTPSIPSIDAVLNGERHDYMYMCARTDGSGYHHFSKTLQEHNNYASQYHNFLDTQGIR